MSVFKNKITGDITSVFGPVHDNFALRAEEELVFDDRDAERDQLAEFVLPPAESPTDPASDAPAVSRKSKPTHDDVADVDNPKE